MRLSCSDAGISVDNDNDLTVELLLRRCAFQLRSLEKPVLDVEDFLLRKGDLFVDHFGTAHNFESATVKFRGNVSLKLDLAQATMPRDRG